MGKIMGSNTTIADDVRGLAETLLAIFVVLKLTGLIHWSWWWVFAPFWIPAAVALIAIVVLILASKRSKR